MTTIRIEKEKKTLSRITEIYFFDVKVHVVCNWCDEILQNVYTRVAATAQRDIYLGAPGLENILL